MKTIRFQGEDPWTIESNNTLVSLDIFKTQWTKWDDWTSFKQGVGIRDLQRPLATSNILHLHDSIFANFMQVILSKSLY